MKKGKLSANDMENFYAEQIHDKFLIELTTINEQTKTTNKQNQEKI